jgi:peptidyl-tRNA hydrolase
MMTTKTTTTNHEELFKHIQHEKLLKTIQYEAALWVYGHELKCIVLTELLHQTQAFHKPSMRRQLMCEIRKVSKARIDALYDSIQLCSVASPSRQALMKEIRARGMERAMVKGNHDSVMRELLQHFRRRKVMQRAMSKGHHKSVMQELLQRVYRRKMMEELRKYTSPRKRLVNEILFRGMKRIVVRENHMEELLREAQNRQERKFLQEIPSIRKELMSEIRAYTSSRNLAKERKKHMLVELLHQTQAFHKPSMRRQLMCEIRNVSKARIDASYNSIQLCLIASPSHQALMKEIRARGVERAVVKDNHESVMRDLLQHFRRRKVMQRAIWLQGYHKSVIQELLRGNTFIE